MNEISSDLLTYIDASPTPFHAADNARQRLLTAGFEELQEGEKWKLKDGRGYFILRHESSFIAFRLPPSPLRTMRIIGAHTDSPNLRLKPIAEYEKHGYLQLGIAVYGGALRNSWLDRDLGIAGRIFISSRDGNPRGINVQLHQPVCRIPQLAIHLDRKVNEGLKLNPQKHLPPVFGTLLHESSDHAAGKKKKGMQILEALASKASVDVHEILSFDLQLYPIEESRFGGLNNEFIFAPRLDNLAMCHAGIRTLCDSDDSDGQDNPAGRLSVIALFDNEEVGSESARGAGSPFLADTLERIFLETGLARGDYLQALRHASFLSADMAHALHPNYPEKHDDAHRPQINGGPVIKVNANMRYATDAEGIASFIELCRRLDIPYQQFINRSDLSCGSTIGPITAAGLGISVLDVGSAMLSMHSAREMAGSADPEYMTRLFKEYLISG